MTDGPVVGDPTAPASHGHLEALQVRFSDPLCDESHERNVSSHHPANPLRGPRKVLRRVPSALRCPHPETSQKRSTQRMRGPFSRLTDSWVPLDPRRSSQRASKPPEGLEATRRRPKSAQKRRSCALAPGTGVVSCKRTATPDRSISSSSSIACTQLINRLASRLVREVAGLSGAHMTRERRRLSSSHDSSYIVATPQYRTPVPCC